MRYLLIHIIFFLVSVPYVSGQQPNFPKEISCQNNWTYIELDSSFTGRIIFHETSRAFCGPTATASVSLVVKGSDTLRVLELCNMTKKFEKGTVVTIKPEKVPSFGVGLLAIDPLACRLMTTYFGYIEETKK